MDKPLKASTAYVTWQQGGENNKYWKIVDTDGNIIDKFPKSFTEKEMMQILKFARGVELEAFNIGIDFGKTQYKKVYEPKIAQLLSQVNELEQMNINLSNKLEKFIIGDEM